MSTNKTISNPVSIFNLISLKFLNPPLTWIEEEIKVKFKTTEKHRKCKHHIAVSVGCTQSNTHK